jgi:hypothetical protein
MRHEPQDRRMTPFTPQSAPYYGSEAASLELSTEALGIRYTQQLQTTAGTSPSSHPSHRIADLQPHQINFLEETLTQPEGLGDNFTAETVLDPFWLQDIPNALVGGAQGLTDIHHTGDFDFHQPAEQTYHDFQFDSEGPLYYQSPQTVFQDPTPDSTAPADLRSSPPGIENTDGELEESSDREPNFGPFRNIFGTHRAARQYLEMPKWFPEDRSVPPADTDWSKYVKEIYDAMIDVSQFVDTYPAPGTRNHVTPWIEKEVAQADIEARAWEVLVSAGHNIQIPMSIAAYYICRMHASTSIVLAAECGCCQKTKAGSR